jgi:hypothetical protein
MSNELSPIGYRVKTREELKSHVPAAFSHDIAPDLTDRYSFFSTEEFLDAFEKLGWFPYSAKQNGANRFSRHVIRMHNSGMGSIPVNGDKILPQLILDNSHDGFTKAQIHLGAFRFVCENGLVIAIPGLATSIKFLHVGVNQKEMMEVIADHGEQLRKVAPHVSLMQEVNLEEEQKKEFAMKSLALRDPQRFLNADGSINEAAIESIVEIEDLYEPVRSQDEKNDLWTVFNVIQERTVNGEFEVTTKQEKKRKARPITNAKRGLEYNKKLWALAEEFMPELV